MNDLNNQQKKHVNIGLDIGTTSVGWAIIDNDYNVIDYGVRLFEDPCEEKTGHPKNEQRRIKRCQRRLLRRRKHRKDRFIQLVLKNKDIFSFNEKKEVMDVLEHEVELPWDVKSRGLQSQLPKEKLIYILYHYLSHRGFTYLDSDKKEKNENSEVILGYVPDWIKKNVDDTKKFTTLLPSQKQCFVFGKLKYQDDKLNRSFSISDWEKEIRKILSNQTYLSDDFKKEYLNLFLIYRDYSVGPGSEKSPTPYGLYSKIYNSELKKCVVKCKGNNLWDCLVGKCSWFDGSDGSKPEQRIEINSASAIIFNLLNDLQNLRILNTEWRISKNEKKLVFVSLLDKSKKTSELTIKKLATIFKCSDVSIKGYRISGKKNKPTFTNTKNIKIALNFLKISSSDFIESLWQKNFNYVNEINKLIHLKSSFKDPRKLYIEFIKLFPNLSKVYGFKTGFELYMNENFKKIESHKKYSAYSQKALNEIFIPKLLDDELGNNSECIRHEFKKYDQKNKLINSKTININDLKISENIFSPTVARSVRQTFKVINAILTSKNYSNFIFDCVSLEMCRDKNTKDERDRIRDINSFNEQQNKQIREFIENAEVSNIIKLKILLAQSNDWIDPYDLKVIRKPHPIKDDLLKWSGEYEIDHIIPFKYFHNDSRSNKVLTSRENNFEKGRRTPYEWLGSKSNWNDLVTKFKPKKFINDEWILDKEKIENFQITDIDADILFKMNPRKLVDTRYTTKFVCDNLHDFFEKNQFYAKNKIKVFTINGAVTSYFRNKFCWDKEYKFEEFKKDRDDFKHHAIDAIIVALFAILPPEFVNLFRKIGSLVQQQVKSTLSDEQKKIKSVYKGIIDKNLILDQQFNSLKIKKIVEWINHNKPKFSRMLKTNDNVEFFDESNYSYRLDMNKNVVTKEKINIFDDKNICNIFYLFDDQVKKGQAFTNSKCLLNKDVIEHLRLIYINYKQHNVKNPFRAYMEEQYQDKNPIYLKFDLNGYENKIKNISFEFLMNKRIDTYFKNQKIGCINKSLKPIGIDCYFKNGKWFVIPLIVTTYDFNKNEKKKDYFTILDKLLLDRSNFKFTLKNGQTFINKNSGEVFYYVSYFISNNKIGIRPVNHRSEIIQKTLAVFFTNFKICDFDILGNKYERKDI